MKLAGIAFVAFIAFPSAPPPPVLGTIEAALQAHGVTACESTDFAIFNQAQDGKPFPEERTRRARIVVVAPQACPTVDPHTGDVYGADANKVSVIGVFVFESPSALRRHAESYLDHEEALSERRQGAKLALFRGIGYVLHGNTLITLNELPPPGMEQAFSAAMSDLGARRGYTSTLWRYTHRNP